MRVSTGMIFEAGVQSMQKQSGSLLHTQQQVASGRRLLTPSDDPVAAARAVEIAQSQALNENFLTTQKVASEALGLQENSLVSVGNLIGQVRQLAVQAGNAALSGTDRQSMGAELRQRFDELVGLANAADGSGQFLFSGYMGATQPFAGSVAGGVTYAGDDGRRKLQVSANRQVAVSDSGNDVFMRIRNGNGTFVTSAAAGNTGNGVIGPGSVIGSFVQDTYTVSFSAVGPVLNYTVTGATSGVVATGPYQSGQAITFNGASITIEGAPVVGDQFTVAPSSSQSLFTTLANLINAVEAPIGAGSGNTVLANRLGEALTNLDQAQDNILRVRTAIGARMGEVDSLGDAGADLALQYSQALSRLQDVDYAEAISRLTQQQTTLEAAQKSFVQVSGLNLFNYV